MNVVDGQTITIGLNGAVEQIIAPHGTAGSELYTLINTSGDTTGSSTGDGQGTGAIKFEARAGGIGLLFNDAKDLG